VEKSERIALLRGILASAWWPQYQTMLRDRQARVRKKLELGSETRFEDRQRGAIATLEWAATFLEGELRILLSEQAPPKPS
jgi:hypothetical protein